MARLEQQLAKAEAEVARGGQSSPTRSSSDGPAAVVQKEREKLAAPAPTATRSPPGSPAARGVRTPGWGAYLRLAGRLRHEAGAGARELLLDARAAPGRVSGHPRRRHQRQVVDDALREALLRAHGLRAGAYLSPHITGDERVLVDGRPVSDELRRRRRAGRAEVAGLPPRIGETTQFEVLTVAALLAFAGSGLEAVALEAGLGGRLDATNVVWAPVVVLTNIALEHTEVLGDTRELIFAEKAAVIKGGDAVFGELAGLDRQARRACSAAGDRAAFSARGGGTG